MTNIIITPKNKIEIDKFNPISGSGSTFKKLPERIMNRKAVINIQNLKINHHNQCFKFALLRSLYPTEYHSERITKNLIEKEKLYNWKGIKFPLDIKKGPRIFEKNNPGIKICIIGYDDTQKTRGGFFPLRPV